MNRLELAVLMVSMYFGGLASVHGQTETPRYGGVLDVGTVHVTLSALSWDPVDWSWKFNHDAGQVYETLLAADLNQSKGRGGKYPFTSFAFLPSEAIRGELAQAWEWETPTRLVVRLRKGVVFPEKPGVMVSRELVADDVILSQHRMALSPKQVGDVYSFIARTTARDKYTLVYDFNEYVADWDLRLGYGFTAAVVPKEVVDAGASNWKNANGSGPFRLTNYTSGSSQTYERNSVYWGTEAINQIEYKIPFIDALNYRIIKDQSTQVTALRTGKLDILESIPWEQAESLQKSAPELKWSRFIGNPHVLALRIDTAPLNDIRVRKALNYAVDKETIVKSFYGGHAEMLGFPMHPDWAGYYEPLETMPEEIKKLFRYDVGEAQKLLVQAGLPNGFSFKVQVCSCNPVGVELLSLLAGYYEQIKVKLDIEVMEYGAHISVMSSNSNAPGYFFTPGMANPFTTTRVNFISHTYNPAQWNDPGLAASFATAARERDEVTRQAKFRDIARHILLTVPYVFLPAPHYFSAWWPWVKNYNGELRAGAARPGPIYARIWIDHDLKARMGY